MSGTRVTFQRYDRAHGLGHVFGRCEVSNWGSPPGSAQVVKGIRHLERNLGRGSRDGGRYIGLWRAIVERRCGMVVVLIGERVWRGCVLGRGAASVLRTVIAGWRVVDRGIVHRRVHVGVVPTLNRWVVGSRTMISGWGELLRGIARVVIIVWSHW